MASRRTLTATNFEALGVAALAELLLEVSTGSAPTQRRLRLALAAAEGAAGAAREVRKRPLAFELLVRFLQLADGVMARCSDSTGVVIGAFRRAAPMWSHWPGPPPSRPRCWRGCWPS